MSTVVGAADPTPASARLGYILNLLAAWVVSRIWDLLDPKEHTVPHGAGCVSKQLPAQVHFVLTSVVEAFNA
jgi:hypothetical protein